MKKGFEDKIGINISQDSFKILVKDGFSKETQNLINTIVKKILENGVVTNKELLLRESDKGIVLRTIGGKKERIINNLKQYYGHDQAKTMVRIIGQPLLKDMNHHLIDTIVDITQKLIQPNITLNKNETEERKKKSAINITPIMHKIKTGENAPSRRGTGWRRGASKTEDPGIPKKKGEDICTEYRCCFAYCVSYSDYLPAAHRPA